MSLFNLKWRLPKWVASLYLFLPTILLLTLNNCDRAGDCYLIEGTIRKEGGDYYEGQLYLRAESHHSPILDSTFVKRGKFRLKGEIEHPDRYLLIIKGNPTALPLFLESVNYRVEANLATFPQSKIKGGESDYLFKITNREQQKIAQKYNLDKLFKEGGEELKEMVTLANCEMKNFKDSLYNCHPLSYYSLFNLYANARSGELKRIKEWWERVGESPKLRDHPLFQATLNIIELRESLLPGAKLEDYPLLTEEGDSCSIAERVNREGETLLLFLSLNNQYCREVLTALDGKEPILPIFLYNSVEEWHLFKERNGLQSTALFVPKELELASLYNISLIPHLILVDSLAQIIENGPKIDNFL